MSLEANKALVRRYFEEIPNNPAVCDEIFADTFLFHTIQHASITGQTDESTPQKHKEATEWFKSVWGESGFVVDEIIAENDRPMVRWTLSGILIGEFAE